MSSVIPFILWALLVSVELVFLGRKLVKQAEMLEEITKNRLLVAELIADTRQRLEALENESRGSGAD